MRVGSPATTLLRDQCRRSGVSPIPAGYLRFGLINAAVNTAGSPDGPTFACRNSVSMRTWSVFLEKCIARDAPPSRSRCEACRVVCFGKLRPARTRSYTGAATRQKRGAHAGSDRGRVEFVRRVELVVSHRHFVMNDCGRFQLRLSFEPRSLRCAKRNLRAAWAARRFGRLDIYEPRLSSGPPYSSSSIWNSWPPPKSGTSTAPGP